MWWSPGPGRDCEVGPAICRCPYSVWLESGRQIARKAYAATICPSSRCSTRSSPGQSVRAAAPDTRPLNSPRPGSSESRKVLSRKPRFTMARSFSELSSSLPWQVFIGTVNISSSSPSNSYTAARAGQMGAHWNSPTKSGLSSGLVSSFCCSHRNTGERFGWDVG